MLEHRLDHRDGTEARDRQAVPHRIGNQIRTGVAVASLIMALFIPQSHLHAQCTFVSSNTFTTNGTRQVVRKVYHFTTSGTCAVTASNNVVQCLPVSTVYSAHNYAFQAFRAKTAPPTAYCQWQCPACTIRIDETDGLPVELMDFRVDDEKKEDEPPEPEGGA